MKGKTISTLKKILPLILGVFFVWYSYHITSAEDRKRIIQAIGEANYFWIIISLICGLLSHLMRAWRWNLLLEPMGYRPSFINNVMAILVGYLSNLGIPRSGEFLRATTLSGYEKIPFEKTFGTIVAERVVDLVMLFLIVLIAALLQTQFIIDFFAEKQLSPWLLLLALVFISAVSLIGWRLIRNSSHPLLIKIRNLAEGLLEGITSIFRIRKKWRFIILSFLIWFLYVFMFWCIKFSLPETAHLSFTAIIVGFTVGAFAITTTNGGIGIYPLAVGKVLALYGISPASADAFGWIMWTSQTLMVVIFGGLAFLLLPVVNRNK